jgi:hypothetical protein
MHPSSSLFTIATTCFIISRGGRWLKHGGNWEVGMSPLTVGSTRLQEIFWEMLEIGRRIAGSKIGRRAALASSPRLISVVVLFTHASLPRISSTHSAFGALELQTIG